MNDEQSTTTDGDRTNFAQSFWALVEVNLSVSGGTYKLLTTSTDRARLSRLARVSNETERNPYILYRTLDYATAVERVRS